MSPNAASRSPGFFIIGAQKSGTTSLQRYLSAHPDAYCIGETHFFDFHFDRGMDWYRGLFAPYVERKVLGEKCPEYLFHHGAIRRMAEVIPDARLLVLLRDPVDRAYSQYWHARRTGEETLSFEDALDTEDERVAAGAWNFAYTRRGRYLPQLQRVCEEFPRENLSVHIFEDMKRDPAGVFADVCRFLGIDDRVRPESLGTVANRYRRVRSKLLWDLLVRRGGWTRSRRIRAKLRRALTREASYPVMDPRTRERLAATFEQDNVALARWLERDLSWTVPAGSTA